MSRGPIKIPRGARQVLDADEEVFLLYTRLASLGGADGTEAFRGLGFLDARTDVLSVRLELRARPGSVGPTLTTKSGRGRHGQRATKSAKSYGAQATEAVEIELAQDTTALRSRKGDTGSVLWRASIDFATALLQQHRDRAPGALFEYDALAQARVLELGAGTGLLAVALAPLTRAYTATDIPDLVPLLQKNLALNATRLAEPALGPPGAEGVRAAPLDWLAVHQARPQVRGRIVERMVPPEAACPDVVLVVDCVYHPALVPPLLATLDCLAARTLPATDAEGGEAEPHTPVVLVVVELRAEDVVRAFLEGWLALGGWEVWSLNTGEDQSDEEGLDLFSARYGIWGGWKVCVP